MPRAETHVEEKRPMTTIDWDAMRWLNPPPTVSAVGDELRVVTGPETDFWVATGYGFTHDDGHFLGAPLPGDAEIAVTFAGDFSAEYDQAGLMLRAGPDLWLKAGVEVAHGDFLASAVVTVGQSDWSVVPLPPDAARGPITVRLVRVRDAVAVRYGIGDERAPHMLRLAYLPPGIDLLAGPFCCSPTRAGLTVRFGPVRIGGASDDPLAA
jgi:uncharacterized protein